MDTNVVVVAFVFLVIGFGLGVLFSRNVRTGVADILGEIHAKLDSAIGSTGPK